MHAFNDVSRDLAEAVPEAYNRRLQMYYPILFLGIIAAGAVFAGTNPAYTSSELIHHFVTSQAKFILTESDYLNSILCASQKCKIPRENLFIFNHGKDVKNDLAWGFRNWTWLLEQDERDWIRFNDEATSRTTAAARLFSSGTTGLPKAASISHYNLIAQHTLVFDVEPVSYQVRARY